MWQRKCYGNVNSWELILHLHYSQLWCSSTPSKSFWSFNQFYFMHKVKNVSLILNLNVATLAFGYLWEYTTCIMCIINHQNAHFYGLKCVFFQVFPPEDSGPASKSGLLQGFETHQKESQQPQRQEHQHQVPKVNREVHRTERWEVDHEGSVLLRKLFVW